MVPSIQLRTNFAKKTGIFGPKMLILALFWSILLRKFSAIFCEGGPPGGGIPPFLLNFSGKLIFS